MKRTALGLLLIGLGFFVIPFSASACSCAWSGPFLVVAKDALPPGSEWILALNGPGSKPGEGLALSHCGEYWLRVENGQVIGSIDGTQSQVKRMPLDELRRRRHYPRFREIFSGHVHHGKRYYRPFGSRFVFILDPRSDVWEMMIKEHGRDENLVRLTPHLHSAPNPRDIEGWNFLSSWKADIELLS